MTVPVAKVSTMSIVEPLTPSSDGISPRILTSIEFTLDLDSI